MTDARAAVRDLRGEGFDLATAIRSLIDPLSGPAIDLDLAPEAPWKCPDDCPSFTRRSDIAWQVGTQVAPPAPPAPAGLGEDDSIARLLDEAEDIINAAGPEILAELEQEKRKGRRGRRKRRRND